MEVDFLYKTKRSAKGFSFSLHIYLKPVFEIYMNQFPEEDSEYTELVKNLSGRKDGKGCVQPMGVNSIGKLT